MHIYICMHTNTHRICVYIYTYIQIHTGSTWGGGNARSRRTLMPDEFLRRSQLWGAMARCNCFCHVVHGAATPCNTLQHTEPRGTTLHSTAANRIMLGLCCAENSDSTSSEGRPPALQCVHHTATHCNTLQHNATQCNTLQHTATHCNTLQYTATPCVLFAFSLQRDTNKLCL